MEVRHTSRLYTFREPRPPICIFSSISKMKSRNVSSKISSVGVPGAKFKLASSCFCERDFLGSGTKVPCIFT
ncbi:hypothetical protein L798_06368 [Zootermopsis nevadensis]|uniref:Uncharacterized protein n=1 Tax=Zootermopsis nevadensis TaxID=136037 RepID=A0A067R7R7_ZOONE|nr:hypothetical protein L798_06368 [Zootermopsis nevadensis]